MFNIFLISCYHIWHDNTLMFLITRSIKLLTAIYIDIHAQLVDMYMQLAKTKMIKASWNMTRGTIHLLNSPHHLLQILKDKLPKPQSPHCSRHSRWWTSINIFLFQGLIQSGHSYSLRFLVHVVDGPPHHTFVEIIQLLGLGNRFRDSSIMEWLHHILHRILLLKMAPDCSFRDSYILEK